MGMESVIGTNNSCCVSATASLAAADTVTAYITLDDWPNISPVSSRHGAKRRAGLCPFTHTCNRPCVRTSCSKVRCVLHRRREPSLRRKLSPSRTLESSRSLRPTLSSRTCPFQLQVPCREPPCKRPASRRTPTRSLLRTLDELQYSFRIL